MPNNMTVALLVLFLIFSSSPPALSQSLWQQTSLDSGEVWTELDLGYSYPHITCILAQTGRWVFAGTFSYDSTQTGIYYSSDNGDTWRKRCDYSPAAIITTDGGTKYL